MSNAEIDVLNLRNFGDGLVTGEIEQETNALLDPNIPWTKKIFWQAKSNGCFQPKHFLKEIAQKHPEIKDPEEIARLAFIEYSRQNMVYGLMKKWAGEKEDQSLFDDMTKTPYPRPADLKFEREYVPESFAKEGGIAKGLARDPAFFIAERIARIFDYKTPLETRRTQICHTLDVLEQQVVRSSSLQELHNNFFSAINPHKAVSKT